jgi:hypothetical protein
MIDLRDYQHTLDCFSRGRGDPRSGGVTSEQGQRRVLAPVRYKDTSASHVDWLPELLQLYRQGANAAVVDDLIIHGSFGDGTATAFSDLEITVVVNASVFEQSQQLSCLSKWVRTLNSLIIRIDPLQHHGAFFLWPALMKAYDETILPLCAYEECWSLAGRPYEINMIRGVAANKAVSRQRFNRILASLYEYERNFFAYGKNLYSIKRFLSNFFMLPVYYFQAQGESLSKRSAIHCILTETSPNDFNRALLVASDLREKWPDAKNWQVNVRKLTASRKIPGRRLDMIACNLFRDREAEHFFNKEALPIIIRGAAAMNRL